jgi:hypothetical protein
MRLGQNRMRDGTRLIFWLDLAVLFAVAFLVIMGKWDWVIAMAVALIVLNFFDRWTNRSRRRS